MPSPGSRGIPSGPCSQERSHIGESLRPAFACGPRFTRTSRPMPVPRRPSRPSSSTPFTPAPLPPLALELILRKEPQGSTQPVETGLRHLRRLPWHVDQTGSVVPPARSPPTEPRVPVLPKHPTPVPTRGICLAEMSSLVPTSPSRRRPPASSPPVPAVHVTRRPGTCLGWFADGIIYLFAAWKPPSAASPAPTPGLSPAAFGEHFWKGRSISRDWH